jgi:hypothetical protein
VRVCVCVCARARDGDEGGGAAGGGQGGKGVRLCLVERGERGREGGGGGREKEAGRGKLDQSQKAEREARRESVFTNSTPGHARRGTCHVTRHDTSQDITRHKGAFRESHRKETKK